MQKNDTPMFDQRDTENKFFGQDIYPKLVAFGSVKFKIISNAIKNAKPKDIGKFLFGVEYEVPPMFTDGPTTCYGFTLIMNKKVVREFRIGSIDDLRDLHNHINLYGVKELAPTTLEFCKHQSFEESL